MGGSRTGGQAGLWCHPAPTSVAAIAAPAPAPWQPWRPPQGSQLTLVAAHGEEREHRGSVVRHAAQAQGRAVFEGEGGAGGRGRTVAAPAPAPPRPEPLLLAKPPAPQGGLGRAPRTRAARAHVTAACWAPPAPAPGPIITESRWVRLVGEPHRGALGWGLDSPILDRGQSRLGLQLPGAPPLTPRGPQGPNVSLSFLGTVCRLSGLGPVSTPPEPLRQEHRRPLDKALTASEPAGPRPSWERSCRGALSSAPPTPMSLRLHLGSGDHGPQK